MLKENPSKHLPSIIPLENIRIATPCHADWNRMQGDDRVRFCQSCEKNVYNLSAMTKSEAQALIAEKEGNLCGRYAQRADGTIVTTDCPIPLPPPRHPLQWAAAAFAALVAWAVPARAEIIQHDNPEWLKAVAIEPNMPAKPPQYTIGVIFPPAPIKLQPELDTNCGIVSYEHYGAVVRTPAHSEEQNPMAHEGRSEKLTLPLVQEEGGSRVYMGGVDLTPLQDPLASLRENCGVSLELGESAKMLMHLEEQKPLTHEGPDEKLTLPSIQERLKSWIGDVR